ncbi:MULTISPECIES: ATP-binding protein [Streptosporangium]|uniref:Anti-sigma regulatory factor, serine/threonine protein kinase n=2 Tax=Streptosporangium TaxID=2000 RepID=D2B2P3_STRRD|nr:MULTISPECIES: ATP-binding protein [Streptosporangium]ACZ83520.1 putative anti-sigma regulatory factor, serine/threonine protein kinase [Streptosporangium roseum DSM 43021]SFJ96459.1 Anti-sigma regulatory factor (Ser/Thr protein kinase) [Streptosporangium canum]
MATVELTFSALPAHVRTARLVATAIARRTGVEESLLDEVRLAVGEACSRAVEAHRLHCPGEPIRIELRDDLGRFEVTVTDSAPSDELEQERELLRFDDPLGQLPDTLMTGFGIAVIVGLADDVQVYPSQKGMRIRMSWPAATNGLSPV